MNPFLRRVLIDDVQRLFILRQNVASVHLRQHLHLRKTLRTNRLQRLFLFFRQRTGHGCLF